MNLFLCLWPLLLSQVKYLLCFCKEFDESLTQKTLLIAHRATAHKVELMANTKIELQKLPPASPELNSVERFFKELRQQMACKVFNTL